MRTNGSLLACRKTEVFFEFFAFMSKENIAKFNLSKI